MRREADGDEAGLITQAWQALRETFQNIHARFEEITKDSAPREETNEDDNEKLFIFTVWLQNEV